MIDTLFIGARIIPLLKAKGSYRLLDEQRLLDPNYTHLSQLKIVSAEEIVSPEHAFELDKDYYAVKVVVAHKQDDKYQ